MDIGSRLKEGRMKKNLTQQEAADQLNVSRSTISSWENERTYPDLESLISLSDLYEQSLDELLREDQKVVENITSETKKSKRRKYIILGLLLFFIPLTLILGYQGWRNNKVMNPHNVEDFVVSLNGESLNNKSVVTLQVKIDSFHEYTGYFIDTDTEKTILQIEIYQNFTFGKSNNEEIIVVPLQGAFELENIEEIRVVNLLESQVKSIYIK
ncbi:helix-turn-helix domain-containing protein [Jeotgalibaca caeni]|uniref:helix-turn-helix domain-containing protein n=1 Tax=Jeotgalibaca caeni TaxID=3028623 RepID=UPI00237DFE38|nr:helix-turn-helix domain-containing protein [Jeotgalibaca caeni]MDE1549494.1 helix-turn-helix domain-containing protein [Jeotgalibaca caeni]